jgi:hypothetical protein
MEDRLLLDYELKPEAIERLRSVNEALEGPSRMQVRRTDEAIARNTKELIDASSEQSKTIRFALASVGEDVTRIFGEAIRISAKRA